MAPLLKSAAAALGMTTLCNLWLVAPLVSHAHRTVYHWSGTPAAIFVPVIRDFCLFWLILTLLLIAVEKSSRGRAAAWSTMLAFLPWIALKTWALLEGGELHRVSILLFGLCSIAALAAALLWRPANQLVYARIERLASNTLCSVSIVGVMVLGQMGWFSWQVRSLNQPLPLHIANPAISNRDRQKPRVIWILLDELSYQQVYGNRAQNLSLPEFDRLASESTVFSQVIPAGIMTEIVMPSLIAGQPVNQIGSSADGRQLTLRDPNTGAWKNFNQHDTVFQDALNAHYRTAIAGWYIPYCRILPEVLDQCYWNSASQFASGEPYLSRAPSLQRIVASVFHSPDYDEKSGSLHVLDYSTIYAAADRMLEDNTDTFLLIHMPIPHPEGIYNRSTGKFATRNSSYLDNLALADKYLAHVRSLLERKDQWDSSTIIVMGDHSWRTRLFWSALPQWTGEEQRASHGGQFDDRPAYVVKLPNQHIGSRIDTPFAAVNTRRLLDQLIAGDIESPDQLASWTQSRPPTSGSLIAIRRKAPEELPAR
jgi:hypothetical protein